MVAKTEQGNALDKYVYVAGESETPPQFHKACAIALAAACLQNRVWAATTRHSKLYPNLYTILLAPSGAGKGQAIQYALSYLNDDQKAGSGLYTGKATGAFLTDFLNMDEGKLDDGTTRVFLVYPELANSLGRKDLAQDFVTTMTDLFTGDLPTFMHGTRTKGLVKVGKPCVNWLAGSTKEWLGSTIQATAVEGGFSARCLFIEGQYASVRRWVPEYAADVEAVRLQVENWVQKMLTVGGEMVLSGEAEDLGEMWYTTRERPHFPDSLPSWYRIRELSIKIAMILALAESDRLVIEARHLQDAIAYVEAIKDDERNILDWIGAKPERSDLDYVAHRVERVG